MGIKLSLHGATDSCIKPGSTKKYQAHVTPGIPESVNNATTQEMLFLKQLNWSLLNDRTINPLCSANRNSLKLHG